VPAAPLAERRNTRSNRNQRREGRDRGGLCRVADQHPGRPGGLGLPTMSVRLVCGHESTIDAAQLAAREKLRRVERQWEWLEEASCSPRRVGRLCGPLRRDEQRPGRRSRDRNPLGEEGHDARKESGLRREPDAKVDQMGPENLKPGEPQDRFQGATNLKSARWSKPSQPGGTARAERVRKVAAPGRKWLRAARLVSSETGRVVALRSSGITGSGHQALMPMEGRIFDNPMRGAQVPQHGQRKAFRPTPDDVRNRGSANRIESPKERRRPRGQGHWSTRPQGAHEREVPRRPISSLKKAIKGQGGRVEKANDPQPVRALATPCCGVSRSGEEVTNPEGPANSREASEACG